MLDLDRLVSSPVRIATIELLRSGDLHLIRATSADGAVGVAPTNARIRYLHPILTQLVMPYFVGKNARDLESLVDGVYVDKANYKLAGVAFWSCVAWVEFSVFDLLGQVTGKPVGALLGGPLRREVPIYLSSTQRNRSPRAEAAWLRRRLGETGARVVKVKIGPRMGATTAARNAERLISHLRRTLGDDITIYADANGSYDATEAIEVGKMLEAFDVKMFEEPCPFDDFEATKRVADSLSLVVAGGEQETSLARFQWMIRHRGVDLVQPDPTYNGGLVRTLRVARAAAAEDMLVSPHSPGHGPEPVYLSHIAASSPNLGPYQEFSADRLVHPNWFESELEVAGGMLPIVQAPGLGIRVDPAVLARAERVSIARDDRR